MIMLFVESEENGREILVGASGLRGKLGDIIDVTLKLGEGMKVIEEGYSKRVYGNFALGWNYGVNGVVVERRWTRDLSGTLCGLLRERMRSYGVLWDEEVSFEAVGRVMDQVCRSLSR